MFQTAASLFDASGHCYFWQASSDSGGCGEVKLVKGVRDASAVELTDCATLVAGSACVPTAGIEIE